MTSTTRNRVRRAVATAVTVTAALVLAACGAAGDGDGAAGAKATASADAHNAQDVTFAQGMIPHHRQALEMAELAAAVALGTVVVGLGGRGGEGGDGRHGGVRHGPRLRVRGVRQQHTGRETVHGEQAHKEPEHAHRPPPQSVHRRHPRDHPGPDTPQGPRNDPEALRHRLVGADGFEPPTSCL